MTSAYPRPHPLERVYAFALRLYPAGFRAEYGDAMRRCLRDALLDTSLTRRTIAFEFTRDLIVSLFQEYLAMTYQAIRTPAIVFNALVLAGISTILALALYAIPQQVLRQGLNDPQIEMATNLTAILDKYGVTNGLQQKALLASGQGANVDMARSLSPFLIVYNDAGQPVGSTAQLDGKTPVPPEGIFNFVRQHGEERVSWQPVLGNAHGVRIAAVIERVNGAQPGFVLAGRNMREVEAREGQMAQMAGFAWLGMLGLIAAGSIVFAMYAGRATVHTHPQPE
jgi:hypothetical protein